MKHSKRLPVSAALFVIEIFLACVPIYLGYLSAKGDWKNYWTWSLAAIGLLIIFRGAQAVPQLKELCALEDAAARMARSALAYGIERFYNMQDPTDQGKRNVDTVTEINRAHVMTLCANSGASYLDPDVFRHWKAVEARLRGRVAFRVVLLDPFSAEKRLRNALNHGKEAHDHKVNLENLIRLSAEFPNLQIRFVQRGMHGTVFSTHDCAFYDPYHLAVEGKRIENRSYCLRVRQADPPHGVGYLHMLKSHFESLWEDGVPLEKWHSEALAAGENVPPLNATGRPHGE